eukprot:TRINITY_DN495_c0_g1_i1.p1 TRINITY_DN495_c0_g1~~TRINITY_DN495_c0_g1_i1.p1  ORF type:complete len:189 (-),score=29.60 TRINITY_DN495_c0_g1_i1:169-735(-)
MKNALAVCFLLFASVSFASASVNAPPQIGSSFVSFFSIQMVPWQLASPVGVEGLWAVDADLQNSYMLTNQSFADSIELVLYSKNLRYQYTQPPKDCKRSVPTDKFFALFSWLPYAQSAGKVVYHGELVDAWTFTSDSQSFILYAKGLTPLRLMLASSTDKQTVLIDFTNFLSGHPPASLFDVPTYCPA